MVMKINKEGLTVIRIGVEPLTMGLITINQNNWRKVMNELVELVEQWSKEKDWIKQILANKC